MKKKRIDSVLGGLQRDTLASWRARQGNDLAKSVMEATIKPDGLGAKLIREKPRLYEAFFIKPIIKGNPNTAYGCEPDLDWIARLRRNGLYHPENVRDEEQLMVGIGNKLLTPNEVHRKTKEDIQKFSAVYNFRLADYGMKLGMSDHIYSFARATGIDLKLLYLLSVMERDKKGKLRNK